MTPDGFWNGRKVFITGHTGFKGSWLVSLLAALGARVSGYALAPDTTPNLFDLADVGGLLEHSELADIRDAERLAHSMRNCEPDLVIHMAAQPLVRRSYIDPRTTWDVNVMGTVNTLDAVRASPSVRGVIVVTSDKSYENKGWHWGYREIDRLGGHDPYSASKAATELVVDSYRLSFLASQGVLLASARAGNVIGGGDWSDDRLLPDVARAVSGGQEVVVRNPDSTRPWQHVLDCLNGYLALGRRLLEGHASAASAYNFGPDQSANVTVGDLLAQLGQVWPEMKWRHDAADSSDALHEATFLYLDSSKARRELRWAPKWGIGATVAAAAEWYRLVQADPTAAPAVTNRQLEAFLSHA